MKKALVLIAVLVAAGVVFVQSRPSEFLITRSRTLAASPELVYAHLVDLHEWVKWSPWEEIDPDMLREYSGAAQGPGASYRWSGNDEVGEGRMTITAAEAPSHVTLRLEFVRPFPATNTTDFYVDDTGLATDVTWAMSGKNDFMAKLFGLFLDLDQRVGADFEKGLAQLDAVTAEAARRRAEEEAAAAAAEEELEPAGDEEPPEPDDEAESGDVRQEVKFLPAGDFFTS